MSKFARRCAALMLAVEALVSHVWAMREESSVGGP